MFDQIEPRTLNSVKLTDAAIKTAFSPRIYYRVYYLLAIEPIIDLSPTRKNYRMKPTTTKKEQKRQIMSIFACLVPNVVSSDVPVLSSETWKDKKASYFLAHLHSVLL